MEVWQERSIKYDTLVETFNSTTVPHRQAAILTVRQCTHTVRRVEKTVMQETMKIYDLILGYIMGLYKTLLTIETVIQIYETFIIKL
jgi:hypothetical protein